MSGKEHLPSYSPDEWPSGEQNCVTPSGISICTARLNLSSPRPYWATEEIPSISWNPKMHYRVHNNLPTPPPPQILNIILPRRVGLPRLRWFRFTNENSVYICLFSHACCMSCQSQPSVSWLSTQCWVLNIWQPYGPPRPLTGVALL
jgi:hypothetical protein